MPFMSPDVRVFVQPPREIDRRVISGPGLTYCLARGLDAVYGGKHVEIPFHSESYQRVEGAVPERLPPAVIDGQRLHVFADILPAAGNGIGHIGGRGNGRGGFRAAVREEYGGEKEEC